MLLDPFSSSFYLLVLDKLDHLFTGGSQGTKEICHLVQVALLGAEWKVPGPVLIYVLLGFTQNKLGSLRMQFPRVEIQKHVEFRYGDAGMD